jgi:hypothetical protein
VRRIEVMGFEVANVILRCLRLRQQLRPSDLEAFKRDVVLSEGIRTLVSDNFDHVWAIAGRDKRCAALSLTFCYLSCSAHRSFEGRDFGVGVFQQGRVYTPEISPHSANILWLVCPLAHVTCPLAHLCHLVHITCPFAHVSFGSHHVPIF